MIAQGHPQLLFHVSLHSVLSPIASDPMWSNHYYPR